MAKKDVMEYFNVIADQYIELQEALKDMESELENNLIDPDRVVQLKQTIEPIKNNYMRISYIVFLLNKPSKFRQTIDKILSKLGINSSNKLSHQLTGHDLDAVKAENKEILDNLKL